MAYPDFTSGVVMDGAAALLNDPSKTVYTYTKQLPYLNLALQTLQEYFELNDVPVTQDATTAIEVASGVTVIDFSTTPALPNDFVEPKMMWERQHGIDPYVPMTRLDVLPLDQEGVECNQLIWYVWESQQLRFLASNQDNDIKVNYTKKLFVALTDTGGNDTISVINAQTYLQYKTAALCAIYLAENPTRGQELESEAEPALDRALGITTKSRQAITTRHRPFRAGFKQRSYQ